MQPQHRRYIMLSRLLAIAGALTAMMAIHRTGGLDSPYYPLWLLAIVALGIFGTAITAATLTITAGYIGFVLYQQRLTADFVTSHLAVVAASLMAGVLAELIYRRILRAGQQQQKFTAISGQLTQEQLRVKVIMSSLADGVIAVNRDRQVQLLNKAAETLTGWDEPSAQNLNYRLIMKLQTADGKDLDDSNDPFAEAWAKGTNIVKGDLALVTKAGQHIPVSLSVSSIYDANRTVTGGIILFRDITAEKAVERQRNEFISTASHEMRTPVAAIEGYLALAQNPTTAAIDQRAKEYLEKAHKNVEHLGELFKDLLSITTIEDSQRPSHTEVFNLTQLVADTVADLQFSHNKKNLTISFNPTADSDSSTRAITPIYYVKANRDHLREVLTNLVENALKFTTQGGVTVAISGRPEQITVSVTDTGMGIAKANLPHLFQKFYRVDNSTTRAVGGTGLGLYLARMIVEQYGGRIWAESTPGQGSVFSFSLPRAAEPATVIPELPAAPPIAKPAAGSLTLPQQPPPAPKPQPEAAPLSGQALPSVSKIDTI